MTLLNEKTRKQIPPLYSQENVKDPMVVCKLFDPTGSWTWYVIEGSFINMEGTPTITDAVDYQMFGLVIGHEPELGYFSERELENAKEGFTGMRALPLERDLYFEPCRLSEIKKLHGIS